jgi:hypothetical protein
MKSKVILIPIILGIFILISSQASFASDPCECQPGTGTPGYWMNHPEAWPVDEITIGGVTYTKDEAIFEMNSPVAGDKTYTLFPALVAAKLNVFVGNAAHCVAYYITYADNWMADNGPVGSGIEASEEWQSGGECSYIVLDNYNNGYLCAPSRDDCE